MRKRREEVLVTKMQLTHSVCLCILPDIQSSLGTLHEEAHVLVCIDSHGAIAVKRAVRVALVLAGALGLWPGRIVLE